MPTTISKEEYMQMYHIVGACMEVHSKLGRGLEEAIYQEALELELTDRSIPFERQKKLKMQYKQHILNKEYYVDLFCNGIIVELKSVKELISDHRAQLFNYMRITKIRRGLLINFGSKSLRAERFLYQEEDDDFILLTELNLHDYVK